MHSYLQEKDALSLETMMKQKMPSFDFGPHGLNVNS